jgi:D-threo-aldose 1-dehydrogenase
MNSFISKIPSTRGFGGTNFAPIVFGTSSLGNLYAALSDEVKLAICREWFRHVAPPVFLDTAGKYGAGMALEQLGRCLRQLQVPRENVMIGIKLGWKRAPLRGSEPTFERGVWIGVEHDAQQHIGYQGILDCWEEGVRLIGRDYAPQLASVHDPDEYLAQAKSASERRERFSQIIEAYGALNALKRAGAVQSVGVGAKDWRVIREIHEQSPLDWVMIANSLTILRHPPELVEFVESLRREEVGVINSGVFHAGFLIGGPYFDYRIPPAGEEETLRLKQWRESLHALCRRRRVSPVHACVQFALSPPGVAAVAMNCSAPEQVAENVAAVQADLSAAFWNEAKELGLIDAAFPFVGDEG